MPYDFQRLIGNIVGPHLTAMASNGISIAEACRRLGGSEKELRAMMADGRLPYRRVNGTSRTGGRIVIRSTDLDALLKPSARSATLTSSRMRRLRKGIERSEFVQPGTDQDLRAPSHDSCDAGGTPVVFHQRCRFAEND
jgi:hypothetical protein